MQASAAAELPAPSITTGRGFQLVLLVIAACAGAYARTAVSPLQETMRLALHFSDNELALLQGPALALPFVLLSVPLGICIDRFSRVRLMLAVTALDVLSTLLTAAAPSFQLLFVARCLAGLAAFAISPIVLSLAADLYAPAQRGRATMAIAIGQFAGMSAAFALGGMLMTSFGPGPTGWRWATVWLTVPLGIAMALILGAREPPRTEVLVANPSGREVMTELWKYRYVILPLIIGIILLEIGLGALLVWTAPTLSRNFAMPADRAGAIVATGLALSGVFGPIAGGVLADLCQRSGGPRRTLALLVSLSIITLPTCLFAASPSVVLISALFTALMTSIGALLVAASAMFMVIIPGELRGLCMGMLAGICVLFGIGVAPLTTSVLSAVMGGTAMIGNALTIVCVATTLLAGLSFALGRMYYREPHAS